MRRPWGRPLAGRLAAGAMRLSVPDAKPNSPVPRRQPQAYRHVERPMGYVDPQWISPVIRIYFPYSRWPRLSPYFEHMEYAIFVEARPYAEMIERFPDEERMYEAGNLWCTSYSSWCVAGEEGHHHLSMLTPISPERFLTARAADWDVRTEGW